MLCTQLLSQNRLLTLSVCLNLPYELISKWVLKLFSDVWSENAAHFTED